MLEIHDDGEHVFDRFNDFHDDLSFARVNGGRDLKIDLTIDGGESKGSVTIKGMGSHSSRVETLKLFKGNGDQMERDIDLASVWDAATSSSQQLKLQSSSSQYGALVSVS